MKALLCPQIEEEFDLCGSGHSLLPSTLQMVNALMFPITVHLKVKVSPGQVGGAAVSCAATSSEIKYMSNPVVCTKEIEGEKDN